MILNYHFNILDIVIPVYGRQESLICLLEDLQSSILNNNLTQLVSIIVVDDASIIPVDISLEHIQLMVIRNNVNSGAPMSRWAGYSRSAAKFVHFHDSDDAISKQWLPELIAFLTIEPDVDLLLTGRIDIDKDNETYKVQKFFHRNINAISKIQKRLIYRNCLGPLGGVVFSRLLLTKIGFKNLASCQDWQMYLEAINYVEVLGSLPDSKFIFNKTGDDRISHNPRKKILGHLQLAKITSKKSIFKRNIRLFYLYTCKQHIYNKGGNVLQFYKKKRLSILFIFLIVSLFWRIT